MKFTASLLIVTAIMLTIISCQREVTDELPGAALSPGKSGLRGERLLLLHEIAGQFTRRSAGVF